MLILARAVACARCAPGDLASGGPLVAENLRSTCPSLVAYELPVSLRAAVLEEVVPWDSVLGVGCVAGPVSLLSLKVVLLGKVLARDPGLQMVLLAELSQPALSKAAALEVVVARDSGLYQLLMLMRVVLWARFVPENLASGDPLSAEGLRSRFPSLVASASPVSLKVLVLEDVVARGPGLQEGFLPEMGGTVLSRAAALEDVLPRDFGRLLGGLGSPVSSMAVAPGRVVAPYSVQDEVLDLWGGWVPVRLVARCPVTGKAL